MTLSDEIKEIIEDVSSNIVATIPYPSGGDDYECGRYHTEKNEIEENIQKSLEKLVEAILEKR